MTEQRPIESPFVIKLRPEQVADVERFLQMKGWPQKLETYDRYRSMEETANLYTDNQGLVNANRQMNGGGKHTSMPSHTMKGDRSASVKETVPLCRTSLPCDTLPTHRAMTLPAHGPSFGDDTVTLRRMRTPSDSTVNPDDPEPVKLGQNGKTAGASRPRAEWRKSTVGHALDDVTLMSNIVFDHYLAANENELTVITKLSTEHVTAVSRVPVRIVLLVDRSGSMLQKIGKDSRHTKITKVKHFAQKLITCLDEGDEIAMVTFGESADVFFALEKLNDTTRPVLQAQVNQLDKHTMSQSTNLSAGLRTALRVFYDGVKSPEQFLESKNCILVFSDGEINAGTTETNELLREVRQNIRQMVPTLDDIQNQWVTISVVTTGSSVSEQAYMLSKTCSSEAYYYINKDAEDTETELFVPVLLRKTAVAWNISYVIEANHDITYNEDKCSKDNRIRLRRSLSGNSSAAEKAYFMYDFPADHARQIGVVAKWKGPQSTESFKDTDVMFKLRVEFTNIKGERFWQEQVVTKRDVMEALNKTVNDGETMAAVCKHDVQMLSSNVLRSAAELVKSGDKRQSRNVMLGGKRSLEELMNEFGHRAIEEEVGTQSQSATLLSNYAKSVVDNLGALIDSIDAATTGESWNKMKVVSTAIMRESPNVSDTIVGGDVLCPIPEVEMEGDTEMCESLRKLANKNKRHSRLSPVQVE